uniref:G-protein coupled receptors family 1 profile domain-containing protein n=1 Tax=Knipowitschia caucasica TaxID=637954 RepID=A0AAV2JNP7_KNICA
MDTLSLSVNAATHAEPTPHTEAWDPFNRPIPNVEPWNFTVLAVLMFVVTSLSLSENFLVMFVTFRFKQLRQPLNYIIVNLAIADFLVSLTGGIISFLTNTRGYFFLGHWACILEGFAVTFFGEFTLGLFLEWTVETMDCKDWTVETMDYRDWTVETMDCRNHGL